MKKRRLISVFMVAMGGEIEIVIIATRGGIIDVFPQERRRILNHQRGKCSSPRTSNQSKPQREKTRRNPREGISGDLKSQRRSELAPNGISSKGPTGKFQRRYELVIKGINSEAPTKAKRNPREVISGDFYFQVRSKLAPKGNKFWGAWRIIFYVVYNLYVDLNWRKKEITLKRQLGNFMLAEQFLRSVQLLRRSELTLQLGNFYVV